MRADEYTCWQDGDFYLGYLNDYPEYQTQAMSKEELLANLQDLLKDIDTMKDEYDFTDAEQGKFYRPLEELEILQDQPDEIDLLIKKPLKVPEFKPLTREEIYRQS
jgi:hypothetical protein